MRQSSSIGALSEMVRVHPPLSRAMEATVPRCSIYECIIVKARLERGSRVVAYQTCEHDFYSMVDSTSWQNPTWLLTGCG